MRQQRPLRLAPEHIVFTRALCRELNRLGIPVEYGALRIAVANWWLGNARQQIPADDTQLAAVLSQAISAWQTSLAESESLPGYLIFQMKIFVADRPASPAVTERIGGEVILASKVQAWLSTETKEA